MCWDRSQELFLLCRALAAFNILQCYTQCPLDSNEMMKGPPYILKWAEIQVNLLYTPLHSVSLAEIFPSGGLWV